MKNSGCERSNTGNMLESACERERECVFVCVSNTGNMLVHVRERESVCVIQETC